MATADVLQPQDVQMSEADLADRRDRDDAAQNEIKREADEEEDEDEDQDMKSKALTNLLKTSSVFVAIMADKMKEQQRQNALAARKAASRQKNLAAKAAEAAPARRSNRTQAENKPESEEQGAKKSRGRPRREVSSLGSKKDNITDYISTDVIESAENGPSVQEALADAADEIEEKGEGLGAQDLIATEQPSLVSGGQMREYQLEGLEWLKTLWMNGLCGILADEMGLGKTVQAISLIAFFKENKITGPFLIAAPLSTIRNWQSEFARWTPSIKTLLYHGGKPEREEMRRKHMRMQDQAKYDFPVIITSYEICMNDRNFLGNYKWKYIVVDEGHRLKNMNCKLIKELMTYNSANRLLITGTPLQNNIAELWSLLHFLLPEVFNDLDSFERWFDFSSVIDAKDEENGKSSKRKNNLVSTMHAILKPFLLRRVKTDVETNLPPKREYILYAPLTEEQKDLYREIVQGTARTYLEDKAVERIEARSRTASLKRKSNDSLPAGTPRKSTKLSRAATPMTNASRAATPNSVTSDSSRRGRKLTRKNYAEVGDRDFNTRLRAIEQGEEDVDINGRDTPDGSDLSSDAEDHVRAQTLKLAKQEMSSKKLQNPIMQARLACNSPHSFYWPFRSSTDGETTKKLGEEDLPAVDESLVHASGKLLLLDTLLPHLLSLHKQSGSKVSKRGKDEPAPRSHKVLIFSQFKSTLDILQDYCELLRGWPVCRIDGSVAQEDRYEDITRFNDPKSAINVFLLSTRAGGQGINLAAADTVILFDSDWNPQQDLQAMDRAHRIGQTRPVIVYRFATRGTVEERLLLKADSKRKLEKLVIQKGKFKSLVDGVDSKSGKLRANATAGLAESDLRDALGAIGDGADGFEFEKYDIRAIAQEHGGKLLGEDELAILTDRRPEAYAKVKEGKELGGEKGQVWKVAETKIDGTLEELTTRKNG